MPIIVENNTSQRRALLSVSGPGTTSSPTPGRAAARDRGGPRRARRRPRPQGRPRGGGVAGRQPAGDPPGGQRHPDAPPRGHLRAGRGTALGDARGRRGARPDRPGRGDPPRAPGLPRRHRPAHGRGLRPGRQADHRLLAQGRGRQDHDRREPRRRPGGPRRPGLPGRPRPRLRGHRDHPPALPGPDHRRRGGPGGRPGLLRARAAAHPAPSRLLHAGGPGPARRQGLHPRVADLPHPGGPQGQLRLRRGGHLTGLRRARAPGLRRDRRAAARSPPSTSPR